jgi:hypothetical protein
VINNKKHDSNSIISGFVAKTTQIVLIDTEQQRLRPLHEALKARGYRTRLFYNLDEALAHLTHTDILLIDFTAAKQPKASGLLKASAVLVLPSATSNNSSPNWRPTTFICSIILKNRDLVDRFRLCQPISFRFEPKPVNTQHLALLFKITQSLSGYLEVNALFERILSLVPDLQADFAALLVQEGDETIYYRSTQPGREELIGPAGRRFAQKLLKDGLEGWVLRHNEAVIILTPCATLAGCGPHICRKSNTVIGLAF